MLLVFTLAIGVVAGAVYDLLAGKGMPAILILMAVLGSVIGGNLVKAILVPVTVQASIGFSILGALAILAIFHLATGGSE